MAIKAVLQEYEVQKPAVIAGQQAKGDPLNHRVYLRIVDFLKEKAATTFPSANEALQRISEYDSAFCIGSIADLPKPQMTKTAKHGFLFSQSFQPLRELWARPSLQQLFQKRDAVWPGLTVKAGQWKASRLYQDVFAGVGWNREQGHEA